MHGSSPAVKDTRCSSCDTSRQSLDFSAFPGRAGTREPRAPLSGVRNRNFEANSAYRHARPHEQIDPIDPRHVGSFAGTPRTADSRGLHSKELVSKMRSKSR